VDLATFGVYFLSLPAPLRSMLTLANCRQPDTKLAYRSAASSDNYVLGIFEQCARRLRGGLGEKGATVRLVRLLAELSKTHVLAAKLRCFAVSSFHRGPEWRTPAIGRSGHSNKLVENNDTRLASSYSVNLTDPIGRVTVALVKPSRV
jgi:hypothetical protein